MNLFSFSVCIWYLHDIYMENQDLCPLETNYRVHNRAPALCVLISLIYMLFLKDPIVGMIQSGVCQVLINMQDHKTSQLWNDFPLFAQALLQIWQQRSDPLWSGIKMQMKLVRHQQRSRAVSMASTTSVMTFLRVLQRLWKPSFFNLSLKSQWQFASCSIFRLPTGLRPFMAVARVHRHRGVSEKRHTKRCMFYLRQMLSVCLLYTTVQYRWMLVPTCFLQPLYL